MGIKLINTPDVPKAGLVRNEHPVNLRICFLLPFSLSPSYACRACFLLKICLHKVPCLQGSGKATKRYNEEGRFKHQRDLGLNASSTLGSLCGLCNLWQLT